MVLTTIFAVLNVCLGFALATYLGYGSAGVHKIRDVKDGSRVQVMPEPSTTPSPASPSLPDKAIHEPSPVLGQETEAIGKEDNIAGPATSEHHTDQAAELLKPISPENWNLNEKYVETSILRLNVAMMKSDKRAIQIDNRLRACQGHSDPKVIEDCLRLLHDDCLSFLAEQKEAADKFHDRISEFGNLSAMCEEIEMTNLEQVAQVETTLKNLEYMDFHTDLKAANLRLLEEIKNLYMARHKLRDNQDAAFLAVARQENRLSIIEKQLFLDALTGFYNRIGLETTLFNWWRQGRHQTRQMIAVLFDIDGFGAVNHKFGPMAGDRILYHLAQFLQSSIGKADLLGRYSGQQFLSMLLDVTSSTALQNAELWRQSIEKIIFLYENKPIRITVSAAITIVTLNDTYLMVLERLENIIKQVKQAGPNRIFFHNGTQTAPVESHNIGLQEIEIIM